MPDEHSPVQHALVLRRVNPNQGIARFYSLMVSATCSTRSGSSAIGAGSAPTAGSLSRCSRLRSRPGGA
jgi:hypothetical protein